MAVIREDVVSIGFEVDNNPLGDINREIDNFRTRLGILGSAESGLQEVGREAGSAADQVSSLANSMRGPPASNLADPLREAGSEAAVADGAVADLAAGMEDASGINMSDGMESLNRSAQNPITKVKDLVGKGKEFAKLALDQGIKKLPPQAQLALAATGKLLGVGVKLSKLAIKGLVAGVKALAPHAAKAAKAVGNLTLKLGKGIAVGITAASVAVAGIGTAAVSVGANFEASMSQVAATMGMTAEEADYSNEQYALLANTAKEMGAATKFSAAESAEALNYMALAGYSAEQACTALPTVLNLAASGGMELAAASDMITDSMSALGIEATQNNLTEFGDKLAKTAQKSNTSVAQLGEAVLTVGGTAKTLSGGTTELNTLLGIIADNGVKGAEGGTALRNIMLSLQAPTDTAAKKMKALGLQVYDAEGKMRPMNNILNDLNDSMGTMTEQQKQDVVSTIFNKNDLKSVNALLANSGDRYDELSGYVNDSAGAMANMAETMNDNLTGRVTEFKSAMEGAGIAIYEALGSGNMKDLVQEASGWVTELTKATEEGGLTGLTEAFGGVLAKIIMKASDMLPQFIDLGVSMIESLLDGIVQNEGTITSGITKGILSMISGVSRILPKIITLGVSILKSLILGIVQNRGEITNSVLGGIGAMLGGIGEMLPIILQAGITMVGSLLQGLEQRLPSMIKSGIAMIQNLSQGLLANMPAIVQSGINIVMQLINGLVAALPTILTTGLQLIITLAMGLIDAIPQLISVIPDIIGAIITAIMSVNWLQLGLDIIIGIGGGLVKGITGLFSKGKDAGKEVGDGVVAGLDESTSQLTAATDTTATAATDGLQPDTDLLARYGADMPNAIASGMSENTESLRSAAEELGASTNEALNNSLYGISGEDGAMFAGLTTNLDQTMVDMNGTVSTQMGQIDGTMQTGFTDMTTDAAAFRADFTAEINKTDLYQSGVNIMQGLNNGLISMKATLISTARGIANDVAKTVNKTLDIRSPSRVMVASGEYTGMGLVKGLENLSGKVIKTARNIGSATAVNMSPIQSRYSPDSTSINSSQISSREVHYHNAFTLNMNGASASDSNERKVRRWIKDELREATNGMMRTNPRMQEV